MRSSESNNHDAYCDAVRSLGRVFEVEFSDYQIEAFWDRDISVTKLEEYLQVWKDDQTTLRFIEEVLGGR